MKKQLSFVLALVRTNLEASVSLRGAFLVQATLMALNNLLFFIIWWILFDRFEEIRGWRIDDFAALYGIAAGGYGVAMIFGGGVPELARRIEDGDLDAMLTTPKSVLVQAVAAETRPMGWGDLASGVILVAIGGYLSPWLPVAFALAGVTFVASGVVLHSAAFWLRQIGGLARQATEFVITFSVYPPSLFGSGLKILLYTVIPAGFVSYLPVELVRDFDPGTLALATAGTTLYATFAAWLFHRGLRRYASGNRFGVRA